MTTFTIPISAIYRLRIKLEKNLSLSLPFDHCASDQAPCTFRLKA